MGAAAMLLGGSKLDHVIVLLRPVWNGSSWVIQNVAGAPAVKSVTGLTIGADGSGPFGAGSRAIVDVASTPVQYATTDATLALAGAKVKDIEVFVNVEVRPAERSRHVLWLSNPGVVTNSVSLGFTPINAASNKIRFFAVYRNLAMTEYFIQSADFSYGDIWRHVRGAFVNNTLKLWVDGAYQGSIAIPESRSLGTAPRVIFGGNEINQVYDAYGRYAEARISSGYQYPTDAVNFSPPTGPFV